MYYISLRGKCTFSKIFNLEESLVFLRKYKDTHAQFLAAAKELAHVLKDANKLKDCLENDNTVYQSYLNIIEE